MLGPSGSGKTTVLRMIAGFEPPTAGRCCSTAQDVTRLRAVRAGRQHGVPGLRAVPAHDASRENVAYGLRVKRVGKAERAPAGRGGAGDGPARRATAAAGPAQLSGGQRQRVALARALVNRPGCCCWTSRSARWTCKLREEMQVELKAIQREVGITFVFVTHDQEEALTMSDRIAVFNGGRIEQVGTPTEVYERPATPFVAGFVGTSNLVAGAAARRSCSAGRARSSLRPERVACVAGRDGRRRPTTHGRRRRCARSSTSASAPAARRPRRRDLGWSPPSRTWPRPADRALGDRVGRAVRSAGRRRLPDVDAGSASR